MVLRTQKWIRTNRDHCTDALMRASNELYTNIPYVNNGSRIVLRLTGLQPELQTEASVLSICCDAF